MGNLPEQNGESGREWLAIPPEPGDREAVGILSERRVRRWALVLDARGIPCRIESYGLGWQLLVPKGYLAAACRELKLFEEENRGWPPSEAEDRPSTGSTLATLSVLLILATFHNLIRLDLTLFGHHSPDWLELGKAQAGRILDGEWWRLVTALTLHADWLHLLSNLAIGGIFIVWLCRDLGSGLAWTLLLGSGIIGNLVNALVQPPGHSSVGASTALFGALGIFAALSVMRQRRNKRRRWLLPVAAALALLALLGTEGKNTDLGAHLFGAASGFGLGMIAEFLAGRCGHPGRTLNTLLALLCVAVVAVSWWAALVHGAR
jgi:membrane associated rhomboid family serine protease